MEPASGARRPIGMRVAAWTVLAVVVLSGCSHQAPPRPGVVAGSVSLCYGPGPDLNLRPKTTIDVMAGDRLVKTAVVRSDNEQHSYRFTLPAGRYSIRVHGDSDFTEFQVKAGQTAHADLPEAGCL